jgi:hypothetical protein
LVVPFNHQPPPRPGPIPGFELSSTGGCDRNYYSHGEYFSSEGDLIWLKAASLKGVNPISKAALKAIVQAGFHSMFDSLVDRWIWTITWPMEVTLTGDLSHTFSFDPGDKAGSLKSVLSYFQQKEVGYRVVAEIFHEMYNFSFQTEREFGTVGMGTCEYDDIHLTIDVDL